MNRWWGYVVRVAGTDEQKAIAQKSGIGTTVISRWSQEKNQPSAPLAVQFARAYSRPAVEALVESGYLSESDASEVIEVHRGIEALGDEELLAEVRKRMRSAAHAAPSSSPAATPAPPVDLTERRAEKDALDELIAAREGESEGRRFRDAHDRVTEAPDPPGPEDGA